MTQWVDAIQSPATPRPQPKQLQKSISVPAPTPEPVKAPPPPLEKVASVDSTIVPTTPSAITAAGEDSEDATLAQLSLTPRQSGSMVTHHDDIVTRMKNIEMIELGKHRIKPWYFAPYPQVMIFVFALIESFDKLYSFLFCCCFRNYAANHAFIFVNSA